MWKKEKKACVEKKNQFNNQHEKYTFLCHINYCRTAHNYIHNLAISNINRIHVYITIL